MPNATGAFQVPGSGRPGASMAGAIRPSRRHFVLYLLSALLGLTAIAATAAAFYAQYWFGWGGPPAFPTVAAVGIVTLIVVIPSIYVNAPRAYLGAGRAALGWRRVLATYRIFSRGRYHLIGAPIAWLTGLTPEPLDADGRDAFRAWWARRSRTLGRWRHGMTLVGAPILVLAILMDSFQLAEAQPYLLAAFFFGFLLTVTIHTRFVVKAFAESIEAGIQGRPLPRLTARPPETT